MVKQKFNFKSIIPLVSILVVLIALIFIYFIIFPSGSITNSTSDKHKVSCDVEVSDPFIGSPRIKGSECGVSRCSIFDRQFLGNIFLAKQLKPNEFNVVLSSPDDSDSSTTSLSGIGGSKIVSLSVCTSSDTVQVQLFDKNSDLVDSQNLGGLA